MNRDHHHAVRETDSRSMSTALKIGVRSKRDLRGDKERSFNQKFTDFIRAHMKKDALQCQAKKRRRPSLSIG
jgi:hypothetical protein